MYEVITNNAEKEISLNADRIIDGIMGVKHDNKFEQRLQDNEFKKIDDVLDYLDNIVWAEDTKK